MGPIDDLGPSTRAAVWVLTALPSIFLVLRVYCKCRQSRGLWWDDYVLIASWVRCRGILRMTFEGFKALRRRQ
jgi:hypothetical protein